MFDIKSPVKALVETLKVENLNYRVLVFTGKDVIEERDLSLTQLSAAVTHDVLEFSKKTGKSVERILHEIAFTIKVFEEEFEEE